MIRNVISCVLGVPVDPNKGAAGLSLAAEGVVLFITCVPTVTLNVEKFSIFLHSVIPAETAVIYVKQ